MKKILLFSIVSFLAVSCSKEAQPLIEIPQSNTAYLAELTNELNSFLNEFYGVTKSSDLKLKDVFTLTTEKQTKSFDNIADTVMHVMNFEKGYAVFGHRIPGMEILAFVENGELDLSVFQNADFDKYLSRKTFDEEEEDVENPNMKDMSEDEFRTHLSEMILCASLRMKEAYESTKEANITKSEIGEYIMKVRSMVNTRWTRDFPFNDYVTSQWGTTISAGSHCVVLGQVITYLNFPKEVWSVTIAPLKKVYYIDNSRLVYGSANDQYLASIFLYGLGEMMNIQWANQSYVYPHVLPDVMRIKLGFKNVGFYSWYLESVEWMLNNGYPVPFYGEDSARQVYHWWIVDGIGYKSFSSQYVLHCQFGFGGGASDGWYSNGIFSTNSRLYVTPAYGDGQTSLSFNYNQNVKHVGYTTP